MNTSAVKQAVFEYIEPSLRYLYRLYRHYLNNFVNFFRLYESESKLVAAAQKYWNRDYSAKNRLAQDAHWKDKGIFTDQELWLNLGREHLDLINRHAEDLGIHFPVKQIVEWGCGGGANAVHFAKFTDLFIGIDIASENLDECNIQLKAIGCINFKSILIDASNPESVLDKQLKDVDLFICTYVYEVFPTPAYGYKVLEIASKILKPGGVAFIQIRYNDDRKNLKPKRWGYKLNFCYTTTYSLEEFWNDAVKAGFEPDTVYLKPKQPLTNDECYAYYFLKKK